MIELAINLETIFPGMDICEKIERVSAAGFSAVEFWSWHDKDLKKMKDTCKKCGVKVQAFSGTKDWSLCDREHEKEYMEWISQSIVAAKQLECSRLILFPNHFTPNGCADFRDKYSQEAMIANITSTLTKIAPMLEAAEITAVLEPLCNIGNDAGMSLTDTSVGADIVRAVGSERIRLLCDVFHMQVMHGNLIRNILDNLDAVSYIHLADAPDRHEPGTGEINFDFLCSQIRKSEFSGTVCFEYFPEGETEAGFPAVQRVRSLLTEN